MKPHGRKLNNAFLLPLVFSFLLISSVSLTNIIEVDGQGVDATAYALGLLTPTQWDYFVAGSYVGMEEQIYMPKVVEVQGFPTDSDDDGGYYIVISTGTANAFRGEATDLASDYTGGPTSINQPPWLVPQVGVFLSCDIARLTLSLEIPAGASILSFDWKFATEELPDEPRFTTMRDWAMATVTTSAGTENILLLPNRRPVDVFTAYRFFNNASSALGAGAYPIPNDVVFNAVAPHAHVPWDIPFYTAWFDVRPYVGETIQIDFWVADEWDEYRDSALFLDNLRFGPPNGNLQVQGISAIQTVPDVDFIINKPTAFNISYLSTFPDVVETDIRVDLTDFNMPSHTFAHEFNPGLNHFYTTLGGWFEECYPTGKNPSYGVTLDPDDAIPETDENDNSWSTPSRPAHRIVPHDGFLDLFYVRLHHENEPISDRITARRAELYEYYSRNFLRATYPIARQQIYSWLKPRVLLVKSGWDWLDILDKLADMGTAYNRVIGVANDSWTGWDAADLFDGSLGYTTDDCRAVVVKHRLFLSTVPCPHVETRLVVGVAHEIGHTYGLGDDYPGGSTGGGTQICATGSGYWVAEHRERIALDTFMHFGGTDNNWVDDVDYNILLSRFANRWGRDPEVLLVSGVVSRDGTAELSQRLHRTSADEADIAPGSVGNYYIALLDDLGNTLSLVGFNVTFTLLSDPPREVDEEHFSFTIEWVNGTRLIQLQNIDGDVLATRDVSLNPPSVTVNSPNGGETFTPGTDHTITWSAMDPDGDPLTYNVLISNGVDAKPVPIATGLDQTSFTYDFTNLPGGNQYRIHVEANDGVNVGSDESDDFFTITSFTIEVITQPQSIPEGSNTTYTLNITSYGGFSDPVTLNAESPTAPTLTFWWPGDATVTPVPSASITVSMEVEASLGTNGGYHTLIVSGVAGNDSQRAITNLFVLSHDIAITDITPSKTTANPGDIVSINITVQNQGSHNEVFDVYVYYDNNTIEEQWAYLHAGTRQTLTFTWNTTGVALGNYTISAYALPIPDETDIRAPPLETDAADNIFARTPQYQVIPEFPSFFILPLFMIATLLAVMAHRRKHST